tara:strand:- start:3900 stop:4730 length:831 start_codon:yes stop_codon:yes gene_type:complete
MLRRVLVLFTLINFLFSFKSISQTENLDQNLISEKTIVVYSLLNKETEREKIFNIHKTLSSLGLDVVNYIDSLNTHTSNEITNSLLRYFDSREVKNTMLFSEKNNSISFYGLGFFNQKKESPKLILSGDSVFNELKNRIVNSKTKQKNFLLPPQPEILLKAKIKPFRKILIKPDISKDKVGVTTKINTELPKNIIQVEEKDDYRFYFSNGVNYIIQFYTGTESFIQKTFNLKNLNPTSNKKTTILVLEHTATRSRFFYFNPKHSEKEDVLLDFLSN